ncbi:hypothetical protein PHYSODRAFT_299022 [Phytophthora sojae]|uniref:Uncharacterized protein n=1 Tax=Phytophthora sojae (strain P6497) TaxID=1094619 RepID=G4ZA38_PHYSP|nr:hypothetical protein PHYSODRAFT_299022 [Phytophthora sojae]EGZ21177.1 hypothetical protein PHYSODRAFT_299022 [Phytophthora sojae]|eukprot:XP_009523894.1 hypothetical protein PHYSODRAFT_299022 [Phytophthora sojae]
MSTQKTTKTLVDRLEDVIGGAAPYFAADSDSDSDSGNETERDDLVMGDNESFVDSPINFSRPSHTTGIITGIRVTTDSPDIITSSYGRIQAVAPAEFCQATLAVFPVPRGIYGLTLSVALLDYNVEETTDKRQSLFRLRKSACEVLIATKSDHHPLEVVARTYEGSEPVRECMTTVTLVGAIGPDTSLQDP